MGTVAILIHNIPFNQINLTNILFPDPWQIVVIELLLLIFNSINITLKTIFFRNILNKVVTFISAKSNKPIVLLGNLNTQHTA